MDENEQGGKYREPPMVRTQWAEERPGEGERERERGSEGMNGELVAVRGLNAVGGFPLLSLFSVIGVQHRYAQHRMLQSAKREDCFE